MAEVRELAEEKHIGKTEAIRRLKRSKPKLYSKFREDCRTRGRLMYAEAG